jgi:hypothetical protein
LTQAIDDAVRSAQQTLDRLPHWVRDRELMRRLELTEREAKLRAVAEEVQRLRHLSLIDS